MLFQLIVNLQFINLHFIFKISDTKIEVFKHLDNWIFYNIFEILSL